MANGIGEYEAWKLSKERINANAAASVVGATQEQPDQVAGDIRLATDFAKVTGQPVPPRPLVGEYRNEFQRKIEEAKNTTILSSSPRLAEWLRNPDNAAVAKDDLEGLSWWETSLGAANNALKRGLLAVPQASNQFLADMAAQRAGDANRGFGEIFSDQRQGPALTRSISLPSDLYMSAWRYGLSRIAPVIGGDQMAAAEAFQQRAGEVAKRQAAIPYSPAGARRAEALRGAEGKPWQEQLRKFAEDSAADPGGTMAFLAETAVQSLPMMGAAVGATVLTKSPAVGAGVMGATSYAQERGTGTVDFLREKGIDVSTPDGARAALSDPALMSEAAQRGHLRGLVIGAMDGLSGGLAGKALAKNPAVNMALQAVSQAVTGAAGEAGGQYVSGQDLNLADIIIEGLAEFTTAPIEVGAAGIAKLRERRAEAQAAGDRVALFQELSGQSVNSKLRERLPDAFRNFVEQATADGPVENVYVPADQFVKYFQGQGVDPFELVDTLEGMTRDDLDAAIAGGGDVKIPTATYAARIAGSPHDAFLMQNMRFSPDEMTATEAAEFNAKAEEIAQEMWDEAERQRLEDEAGRTFEQEIYDTMVSRLREAGRSTDVATNEATIYSAFYRVMAARNGMTTEEMLRAFPLPQVQGSLPQGMQFKSIDDLTRAVANARAVRPTVKRGPSLLEFISERGGISDTGGELRARDAEVVKRGKGKKALRLARTAAGDFDTTGRKYGADEVARAVVEAGYLADNPTVMEYKAAMADGRETPDLTRALWDAVDEELRGRSQYVADQNADAEASKQAALDGIEAYLNEIGVGLDSTDAEIRAAYEASRQYAQGPASLSTIEDLAKSVGVDLSVSERNGIITLSKIVAGARGAGAGSRVMDALVKYADASGQRIALTPSKDFGASSVKRLTDFYKRFGFVENKGKSKDFTTRETMVRNPSRGYAQSAYDVTTTPEFKVWFGDSKVVDRPGVPTVVYHATDDAISAFDRSFLGRDTEANSNDPDSPLAQTARLGFWFSDADNSAAMARDKSVAAFLRIESPAEFKSLDHLSSELESAGSADALRSKLEDDGRDGISLYDEEFGGVSFVAFYPEQIKSVDNVGTFNPNDPRIMYQNTGGPRGSIQFGANGEAIMRLFERADLSTVLHESGHFFLSVMQDMAAKGEANASADIGIVREWWKANAADVVKDARKAMPDVTITTDDVNAYLDTGSTGDVMKDAAIDVGTQEQWARALETYFMEGRAPSIELRSAFEKFRAWLLAIYRKFAGLDVKVNDELREVFDRMLATDEEIAAAKSKAGSDSPIFTSAEAMGLSAEEFDRFTKLRAKAEDDAKAKLLGEIMKPLARQREAWFEEERAKVREEVERDVNAMPVFRALEWLGNKRWLGDEEVIIPDARLSKSILVDRYGDGVLKLMPRGQQTVYAVEGGVDPDIAAGWFGFGSGDELVRALETAPRRIDAIEAETDKVMNERHGDVLRDGTVEEAALAAIHGDRKGEWIAAELKAISDVAGLPKPMTAKEARATARTTLARTRVRDAMNAGRYLAAERKAAEEAARLGATLAREKLWMESARRRIETTARGAAKGKVDPNAVAPAIDAFNAKLETTTTSYEAKPYTYTDANGKVRNAPGGPRTVTNLGYNDLVAKLADAKRRQLLNHALYSEARKIADEVEKAENYIVHLNKASTRERIAGAGRRANAQVDYLAAIDEILDRYDFRRISGAAEARRGALAAFIDRMKEAGRENELAIPDAVLADVGRKPYKTVPVEELRGAIDSLKNLEHIAKRWDDLIDAVNKRKLDEAADAVVGAFEANLKRREPGRVATTGEARRKSVRSFLDLVLNTNTILREVDGFADQGAAWTNIKAPIDEANNRLIKRKNKAAADLEALYSEYSKADRRRMAVRTFIPELNMSISKWEMISIALNTGNEGNYQRITDKRVRGSFTPDQVGYVLSRLDERDARFVQGVWDYLDTFRADIAARERRATGVEPTWVEAKPITIAGVDLKGGYYPIKYDGRLGGLASDFEAQDISQALMAGKFGKAQTRNGHLKQRGAAAVGSVDLDPMTFHRHVNQVIYDLEMSEPIANSWRLIHDNRVKTAFIDHGRSAEFDALEIWLKDVAEGDLKSADLVGRVAQELKSNFTAAKLAFNLSNTIAQVAGLAQSIVVVGKKDFAIGVKRSFRNGVREEIAAKSAFMSERQTTFNKDIYDFASDPKLGPLASSWGDFKKDWIAPMSFYLMTKVQWHLVDVPTWLAGYNQGLRQFDGDEAKAITHADNVVKRAQASGLFVDRSSIERGSLSMKSRQHGVTKLFTTLASYMFAKFNLAYERSARAGRVFGEEGVSLRSFKEAMSYTIDMAFLFMVDVVIMAAIRGKLPSQDDDNEDEAAAWAKFLAKETAFSALGTVPFVRDAASLLDGFDAGGAYGAIMGDLVSKPMKQIMQGEVDAALVKSIVNAAGLVSGAPALQINRGIDAAWRQAEGEDVSPIEYLLGRMGNAKK